MTHASLFSGIGGFDLAAEWAGWTNAFNCEIDPFCRKVLKYHFPNAEQYEDIRTTDFTVWKDRIDVLTGGFPCQPFSLAGKRRGTEDYRYLWPAMLDVIRTVRPRWVVGENVYGIVNWSEGLVFERVCADLETAGYEVQPYIIPACGVCAPHRRDRCWFVPTVQTQGLKRCVNGRTEFMPTVLLPTPHASDASRGGQKVTGLYKTRKSGLTYMSLLNDLAVSGLLPTPTANDAKNVTLPASQGKRNGLPKIAMQSDEYRTGTGSRLNPLYVAEMMGFPGNWLVSPFLGGAGKPSKPAVTP